MLFLPRLSSVHSFHFFLVYLLFIILVCFAFQFGMFETLCSSIIDTFPKWLENRKAITAILLVVFFFVVDLPFTTNGAMYLFQLSDWYASVFGLLVASGLETVIIAWIYGADRFSKDIELMTGKQISAFLRFMWCVTLTFFLTVTFIMTLAKFKPPDYGDGYVYQPYAIGIGYTLSVIPLLPIVGQVILQVVREKGTFRQRFRKLLAPSALWGPRDPAMKELYDRDSYIYEESLLARIKTNIIGRKDTPVF